MVKGPRFYVPLSDLTSPLTGECLVDLWWIVHPDLGAMFWVPQSRNTDPYPAANKSELIVRRFLPEGHEAVQVNTAYLARALSCLAEYRNSHSDRPHF